MPEAAQTLSKEDALKRLKGATVTMPVIEKKTGQRAFTVDPQTRVRKYQSETVPLSAEHVLKVGDGYVVTVDGRRLPFA
jgi:hypothetical protein